MAAIQRLAVLVLLFPAIVAHAQSAADDEYEGGYSARARVEAAPSEAFGLQEAEADAVETSMGPAFSSVESMPGVVPVFSGVPYMIVRGAAPAASLSYYDGIPVPSLFHLALGPSVMDPALAGPTRFVAGATSVRYGAHLGGVLDRGGPDAKMLSKPIRYLELSLLDAAGLLNVPTERGAVTLSWRYGTPGLMLRALGQDATLGYYNYQLRYQTALSTRTTLTLVLLGANDHLGERKAPADDIDLNFQRVLARLTTRVGAYELGSSLLLSSDASTLGQQVDGKALRATENVYLQWHTERLQLRMGAEFVSAAVKLARGNVDPNAQAPAGPGAARQRDLVLDPDDFLDGQPYASVPNRTLLGAYAELRWSPWTALRLTGGVRADAFIAGSEMKAAVSPMLRARLNFSDRFEVHGAAALTHKPRTSPVPLPGLNDVAIDRGVEAALQTEFGSSWKLDASTQLEANLFYHQYRDAVYLELILDCQGNTDPSTTPGVRPPDVTQSICRSSGLPTASGEGYGIELFLKRDLTQRLSGFLSYTHAYANATARDGTRFSPQGDVRHIANTVLLYRFGGGWSAGARLHVRTGKVAVNTILAISPLGTAQVTRLQYRLPTFLRLDLHLNYAHRTSFGWLTASLGWQNVMFSREATNRDCRAPVTANSDSPNGIDVGDVECAVDYQPSIVLPNIGLRADF
ncbi:MAG TPA: TonB-dependent receptor [Polyangiales bacterium]|nr:TonB-dependent receptor [Polyangiales bacterium]